MEVLSSVEWEKEVQSAHPPRGVSADAVPALAGTARRRTEGELPCGGYRMMRVAWSTIAGVQLLALVVLSSTWSSDMSLTVATVLERALLSAAR